MSDYFGKTLRYRVRGNVMLCVHVSPPSDDEWLRAIRTVEELQHHCPDVAVLALSVSDEAVPSTQQRTMVSSRVDPNRLRVAIVAPSRVARLALKAFSLFYPNTRAFSQAELDAAFKFLVVDSLAVAHHDLETLMHNLPASEGSSV